jgi:hypothetical protein
MQTRSQEEQGLVRFVWASSAQVHDSRGSSIECPKLDSRMGFADADENAGGAKKDGDEKVEDLCGRGKLPNG